MTKYIEVVDGLDQLTDAERKDLETVFEIRTIGPGTHEYVWRSERKHTTRGVTAAAKVLDKLRRGVLERLRARLKEAAKPIAVPTPFEWRAWHYSRECNKHEYVAARLCEWRGGKHESRRVQASTAIARVEAFQQQVPADDFAMWAAIMNPIVKD